MPVRVIRFKCQYGCKRKVASRLPMLHHEKSCWYNPQTRTCKTCRYENYYWDDNGDDFGSGSFLVRECNHPEGDKITKEEYAKLEKEEYILPKTNCISWESMKEKEDAK
jgi:hypothetical protein